MHDTYEVDGTDIVLEQDEVDDEIKEFENQALSELREYTRTIRRRKIGMLPDEAELIDTEIPAPTAEPTGDPSTSTAVAKTEAYEEAFRQQDKQIKRLQNRLSSALMYNTQQPITTSVCSAQEIAFRAIGGLPAYIDWAKTNPDKFYKQWATTGASMAKTNINIHQNNAPQSQGSDPTMVEVTPNTLTNHPDQLAKRIEEVFMRARAKKKSQEYLTLDAVTKTVETEIDETVEILKAPSLNPFE